MFIFGVLSLFLSHTIFSEPSQSSPLTSSMYINAQTRDKRQTNTQQARSERKDPTAELKQSLGADREQGWPCQIPACRTRRSSNKPSTVSRGQAASAEGCTAVPVVQKENRVPSRTSRTGPSQPDIQARSLFLFPSEFPKRQSCLPCCSLMRVNIICSQTL